MPKQSKTVRLRVYITVTEGLNQALNKKAKVLHLQTKDAIHQAIVDWAARPVAYPPPTELPERVEIETAVVR